MTAASVAASWAPEQLRRGAREGSWRGPTAGACLGHLQANLVVLRSRLADDFTRFCRANPRPLPLVERTEPGVPTGLRCAPGADLRTDLPSYQVHRDGRCVAEVDDLADVWEDDFVGFLLGCSFTAESRLLEAGVRLRHLELGQSVPMFTTNLETTPVGPFHGRVVVSMRPIHRDQVSLATRVTDELPLAHGAPLHAGDPHEIGVDDLARPEWGDLLLPEPDEVPVFWACGVTPQQVIRSVRPDVAVTHTPGHMFVTDVPERDVVGRTDLPAVTSRPAP